MKNLIIIICLAVLCAVLGMASIKMYKDMKMYEEMYTHNNGQLKDALGLSTSYKKKYNEAVRISSARKIKLDITDKKLQDEIGRHKATTAEYIAFKVFVEGGGYGEVVTEVVYVPGAIPGTTKAVTQEVLKYSDYRVDIKSNHTSRKINYNLHQSFGVNTYQTSPTQNFAEILEYNSQTSEVVATYPVGSFVIEKVFEDKNSFQTGTNLMIGGGGSVALDGTFQPIGYLQISMLSYGLTKTDSLLRFLSPGVSTRGGFVTPLSWNIGKHLPLLNDLYLDPIQVGIDWKANLIFGFGISSTF